jgi:hypothetical protein
MQRLRAGRTKLDAREAADYGRRLSGRTDEGRSGFEPVAPPSAVAAAQYGVAMEAVRRRSALQKALVGPAGEHFVLFRLYQHGMLASLSPPGSRTVDILVLAHDESVIATLQVKTRTGVHMGWQMSEKHEDISAPRYFYAFRRRRSGQDDAARRDRDRKRRAAGRNRPRAQGPADPGRDPRLMAQWHLRAELLLVAGGGRSPGGPSVPMRQEV